MSKKHFRRLMRSWAVSAGYLISHIISLTAKYIAGQQQFLRDACWRIKADQFFVRWCLEKELAYIAETKKTNVPETESSVRKAYSSQKGLFHFERLISLVGEERKLGHYFRMTSSMGIWKGYDKFLEGYAGLRCNEKLFRSLHGDDSIPEDKVFSRAENVFYGFDPW